MRVKQMHWLWGWGRGGGALAVSAPLARCDTVHTYKRGHDAEACNSTHTELHINAGSNVPDEIEYVAKPKNQACSVALGSVHAVRRELGRAHTFKSIGKIHMDRPDKFQNLTLK
jgi:hypothetical protein